MRNMFSKFMKDESGASAAEYAVLLTILAGGVGVAVSDLGTAIHDKIESLITAYLT